VRQKDVGDQFLMVTAGVVNSPFEQVSAICKVQGTEYTRGPYVGPFKMADFRELHEADSAIPGILGIFFDQDPSKDMSDDQIISALANLEDAEVETGGAFHALNAWIW
jgi:hypothetical protein